MSRYPLQRLLEVRKHREEDARLEAGRRRRLAEEAKQEAERAEEAARVFAEERPAREAALFEEIRRQVLERPEVDAYHARLAALAARELELHERAGEARARQAEAERLMREAVQALQQAMREVQKFEEHKNIWAAAERARVEAGEELEAEEAAAQGDRARRLAR